MRCDFLLIIGCLPVYIWFELFSLPLIQMIPSWSRKEVKETKADFDKRNYFHIRCNVVENDDAGPVGRLLE